MEQADHWHGGVSYRHGRHLSGCEGDEVSVELKVLQDNMQEALRAIEKLTKNEVLVGVTSSTNQRAGSEFGNAGIAYEAEYGSPACNIPMRPIFGPGLKRASPEIARILKLAAKRAIEGEPNAVNEGLEVVGLLGQTSVQMVITEGAFAPLAPSTVAARARRGSVGAKILMKMPEMKKGKMGEMDYYVAAKAYKNYMKSGSAKSWSNYLAPPLIDTGAFRQAITHITRERKRG